MINKSPGLIVEIANSYNVSYNLLKKTLMGDISHAKDVQYLIKKIYERKL